MHPDPKRDAQKTEEAGLQAEPEEAPSVAKPDAPGEEGIETAREQQQQQQQQKLPKQPTPQQKPVAPTPARPRQDSLDLQRAAGEGMTAPPSNR